MADEDDGEGIFVEAYDDWEGGPATGDTKDAVVEVDEALVRKRRDLSVAYRRCLHSGGATKDDVSVVMRDLSELGFECRSTWDLDPRVHALNEGARLLYFYIKNHIDFDAETLVNMYDKKAKEI